MSFDGFTQIPEGVVKAFLCTDVTEAISQMGLSEVVSSMDGTMDGKVVVQSWESLPDHEAVLADILQALATVTLALWPMWYGQEVSLQAAAESTLEESLLHQFKLHKLQATRQDLYLPWLKAAVGACQVGKLPVFQNFSRTVQVSQLALAIAPANLLVVLAICDRYPPSHRLLSLARAATWLAQETKTRVAVLIPAELAKQRELDSILYGAIALPDWVPQKVAQTTVEEAKHIIWPIQGKPHPFSPGEQLLAKFLSQDTELASLFWFNQSIETSRGRRYLVDLLWLDGKVVVEVDGYRHHSNMFAFTEDRHRDYELLISGYLVLRLTHDEVITDIAIAVEKIRDVVKFRRRQQFIKREVP